MTDFADALRNVESRLHIPQPARSRVILELAADLEELHRYYLAKGLADEDARTEALDHFDATDDVLAALVKVHSSALRRGMDQLVRHAEEGWARALLTGVLVVVVAGATRVALNPTFVADAGIFLWPVTAVLAWGLAVGGTLMIRLQRFDTDDTGPLRRPLDRLMRLAGAQLAIVGFGTWFELYLAGRRMAATGGQEMAVHFFHWLVRAAALVSAGLAGALILAVVWFLVATRAAVIEDARAALLLAVPEFEEPRQGGG